MSLLIRCTDVNEKGKSVGYMCQMKEPTKSTRKCVMTDNGVKVSMGIVEMEWLIGVCGQLLVMKRGRYWSKGVPGDDIE